MQANVSAGLGLDHSLPVVFARVVVFGLGLSERCTDVVLMSRPVVSLMTGIPLGSVSSGEQRRLTEVAARLKAEVTPLAKRRAYACTTMGADRCCGLWLTYVCVNP
eukprot:scaffold227785_cov25-Prasinocladus_malaysianus.AAC.1